MRDNRWTARALFVGGVLLVAGAQQLTAQKISIAPNIGVYIPTTELVKAASGQDFKQEMSITFGGRMGIALGQRLGLEFTGNYAPGNLKITQSGFSDQTQDANIFTGSGRISYQLVPFSSPVAFLVTGGVGVINRSGAFYADAEQDGYWGHGRSVGPFPSREIAAASGQRRGLCLQAPGRDSGFLTLGPEENPK